MLEKSDRLLRGSRDERIADILALEQAEWGLDAVLDLHRGLLDHAEEVRLAAIEALKAIAQRSPEQLTLTPASFLAHHMFSFTVGSGAAVGIFGFLVELARQKRFDWRWKLWKLWSTRHGMMTSGLL
jgi:hypothetical protein